MDEDEGGVGVCRRQRGADEGGGSGRDVRDVFGSEDDVVVGREVFFFDVGNRVADLMLYVSMLVVDGGGVRMVVGATNRARVSNSLENRDRMIQWRILSR